MSQWTDVGSQPFNSPPCSLITRYTSVPLQVTPQEVIVLQTDRHEFKTHLWQISLRQRAGRTVTMSEMMRMAKSARESNDPTKPPEQQKPTTRRRQMRLTTLNPGKGGEVEGATPGVVSIHYHLHTDVQITVKSASTLHHEGFEPTCAELNVHGVIVRNVAAEGMGGGGGGARRGSMFVPASQHSLDGIKMFAFLGTVTGSVLRFQVQIKLNQTFGHAKSVGSKISDGDNTSSLTNLRRI